MHTTYPRLRQDTSAPPSKEEIAQCLKEHWGCETADIRPTTMSRRVWYVDLPERDVMFRANPGWDGRTPPSLIVKYLDHLSRSGAPVPEIFPTARGALFATYRDYTISLESRLPGDMLFGQGVKYLHCAGESFADMSGSLRVAKEYVDVLFERASIRLLKDDELSAIKKVETQVRSRDINAEISWVMRHGDVRTANTGGSDVDGIWLTDFDSTVFEPALADVVMVRTQWRMADGGYLNDLECADVLANYHKERLLSDNEITLRSVIWVCYYMDRITFLLDRRRRQNSEKRVQKLRERVLNLPKEAFAMGERVLEISGVAL